MEKLCLLGQALRSTRAVARNHVFERNVATVRLQSR